MAERKAIEGNCLVWLPQSLCLSGSSLGFELSYLPREGRHPILGGHPQIYSSCKKKKSHLAHFPHPRPPHGTRILICDLLQFFSGFLGYLFHISSHFGEQILWAQRAFWRKMFSQFHCVAQWAEQWTQNTTGRWIYFDLESTSCASWARSLHLYNSQFSHL